MKRRRRWPFTLTLVAITIFGLFGVIMWPAHPHSGRDHPWHTCTANLRQIDGAKQQWAVDNKMSADDVPTKTELYGAGLYFKRELLCPSSGVYVIGAVRENPTCSHSASLGHSL